VRLDVASIRPNSFDNGDQTEISRALPGETVTLRLRTIHGTGLGPIQFSEGIIFDPREPPVLASEFYAMLYVLQLLDHKPILTAGYSGLLTNGSLPSTGIEATVEVRIVNVQFLCVLALNGIRYMVLTSLQKLMAQFVTKDHKLVRSGKRPRFVKSHSHVGLCIHVADGLYVPLWDSLPVLKNFSMRDEGTSERE
jgi:hypothetical protein